MQTTMDNNSKYLAAIRARDPSADGKFFYAVLTTGVFCYPSCAARPARAENLRFFPTATEAREAGYRPCQRCRPDLAPRAERRATAIAAACRAMDAGTYNPATAGEAIGVGPTAFTRIFREITGVTPKAYQSARRHHQTETALRTNTTVTDAIYEAGFASSGRFYESTNAMLGMTPTRFRAGGAGESITYAIGQTTLGQILAAFSTIGICAILIGDTPATLIAELARRFPRATRAAAGPEATAHLAAILRLIEIPRASHTLPLDIRGTAFQRRVWQALRDIPPGTTSSYAQIAASIGHPRAARAVGTACAANKLAVAVPCHRVVTSTGEISGYAWGAERKAELLLREK